MRLTNLTLLVLLIAPCAIAQTAPKQAVAAGYTRLVFDDEFNSPDTVSPDGTGNYNWYRNSFAGPSFSLPASGYVIKDGYLQLKADNSGFNDGLQTIVATNTAQAWQHGYFEASIRFCSGCSAAAGWPAFWSYSLEEATGQVAPDAPYAELDFMEYYTNAGKSTYITDVHQWADGHKYQNSNQAPTIPAHTNFDTWHTYGCLWTPNAVRYYFDNKLVTTVAVGPGTEFTALEQSKMFLVLGTGKSWPMDVDYVHVWQ